MTQYVFQAENSATGASANINIANIYQDAQFGLVEMDVVNVVRDLLNAMPDVNSVAVTKVAQVVTEI